MRKIRTSSKAIMAFVCAGAMTLGCTKPAPDATVMDDSSSAATSSPTVEAVPATQSATSLSTGEMAVAVPSVVRQAQDKLSRKGYAVSVNGVLDMGTVDAIRNFQRDNGLQTTGALNSETLNALQMKSPAPAEGSRAPASVAEPIQ